MVEIKVMSIQDLLHIRNLRSSYRNIIIFVTTKPNYYNFGCSTFYYLKLADTDTPVITETITRQLKTIIKTGSSYDTIYVCCDAGLSRSPAVALFLAQRLGEHHQAQLINDRYRFINLALYRKLMEAM
jgi:hypothetical protein